MFDSKINSHAFLNSSTWRFHEFMEPENPLNMGEKVYAFRDPGSKTVCVKFLLKGRVA
jgi:hypothetical protein